MADPIDESVFGTVAAPPGVEQFNAAAGSGPEGIGILVFISVIIRFATVIAGLYVLFNFITGGFEYITAGDSKASQKVREKLTSSFLGLVIIVASYVIIGVAGTIFFGRADYFINPTICGPTYIDNGQGECVPQFAG